MSTPYKLSRAGGHRRAFRIYARMNPDVYAGWVTKSMQQRASSTTTANLPTIDRHDALTLLLADADADVDTDL